MIPHYTKIKANKFFPHIDTEYDVLCGTHLKEGWVPNHAFSVDMFKDEELTEIKNLDALLELSKPSKDDVKKYKRYGQ